MSADDAAKGGVADPQCYFRLDNGKANLAPPAAVQWFHMASVDLQNATEATTDAPPRPSDKVGVVESWTWPDYTEGVTGSDVEEVQRRLRESPAKHRADAQASDWVGKIIIEALGGNPAEPTLQQAAQAKQLQRIWTGTGALVEYQADDERRRKKTFVEAGK